MKDLSIIFPAYNEAARIAPTLRSFNNYLSGRKESYELIVVDDGSSDETIKVVEALKHEIPNLLIIPSEKNSGKGHAVRMGMLHASGNIRLFSDADGSTPAEEIEKLLTPVLQGETDIAIGSRYHALSEVTHAQPLYRRVWSRMANQVVQKILLPGIADPHCGFKAFTAEATIKIFSECRINEWSFDLEALTLARSFQFRIKEIPVKWMNDERSKGRLSHLPTEIYNLARIRKRLHKQLAGQ